MAFVAAVLIFDIMSFATLAAFLALEEYYGL